MLSSETKTPPVANTPPNQTAVSGKRRTGRSWLTAVVVFLVVVGILAFGIIRRVRARAKVTAETASMAVSVVSVVSPQRTAPSHELVLPGNVEPYMPPPIYSRTSVYVK